MKGNEEVLTLLNNLLTNELTAINQYFVHAKSVKTGGSNAWRTRFARNRSTRCATPTR